MRKIKFKAWNKKNKDMIEIFDNEHQTEWFLPNLNENYEVMQYTGLKDKNGKEIYEGDILSDIEEKPFYMEYSEEKAAFCFVDKFDPYGTEYYTVRDLHYEGLEIVGNIYENPELLEMR